VTASGAGGRRLRVRVYISPDHDLYHTSLPLSGFCDLERRGSIALDYAWPRAAADRWLVADAAVLVLDLAGEQRRRVAIDLRDGEGFARSILERVDLYFKRAFYPPEILPLPAVLAAKFHPYGLNFASRSFTSTVRLLRTIGLPLLFRGRRGVARLREYLSTPPITTFEQGPEVPMEPKVTFQTRLWTASEVPPGEVDGLNSERVAMVRALRKAFGARFAGGLVPTALAREQYPDDLTPHSSKYVEYLALRKRCLIGVYTRGVEHSLAFKLGETLTASQCLVSVPLRYELPSPLVAGTNYLPYDTIDQCIAACERLLSSPREASEMRRANHEYYLREVQPAAHTWKVLRQCLDQS
jgi:hypothetical protein